MKKCQISNSQSGQAFVFVVLILSLVLIYTVLVFSGSVTFLQSSKYTVEKVQATQLAEAGIDKAVASLNAGGSYNGEGNGASGVPLGPGEYSVTIISKDVSTSIIQATGYIPSKAKPVAKKNISIQVSKGIGASFNYGMQVGNGGINFGNGGTLNGSIYSNGNITGGNSNTITGDTWIAGGTQPTADQQSDCIALNCVDYIFGKNVSGENRQDVGQSFQPNASPGPNTVLNKVSLKLKKVGSPSNPTVRIMKDNGGKPDKNNILASGTLSASSVTTQYGFIDVTFSSTPTLTNNTTYWIMIHANALDNSNYWLWSEDLLQTYTRGTPKWSANWQASNPVWTAIIGDLGFNTYMGGVATYINMGNGSVVNNNVHANTLSGSFTIKKDAYFQTNNGITVQGTSYPNSSDPPPLAFPISDANITEWKNDAQTASITTGNITNCSTLGPGKYVGNLNVGNGCTITIKSPVWITGNFTAGNSPIFKLDPSYGASSGLIIVDGVVTVGNGPSFSGSGTVGSYMFLITTYNSAVTPAITTGNGSVTGVLYAPYGIVNLPNGASLNELVAYQINMGNGTTLNYQTGLANIFFSSGPQGSYSVIKGTYQSK